MKINRKRIGLAIAYILGLYVIIFYCRPIYINLILQFFPDRSYSDDVTTSGEGFWFLMLLVYCIVSFFGTRRTSLSVNKTGLAFWTINWIIDFIIHPLSVLIMAILHNRGTISDIKPISSIENFLLVWFLLVIKHLCVHIMNGRLSLGAAIKKRPSQK